MTMGPGARRRIPLGPKTRPPDGLPCPGRPRKMGLYGFGGGADGQGRSGKALQGVHVPFLSWIAAGGTRCIHQVRE